VVAWVRLIALVVLRLLVVQEAEEVLLAVVVLLSWGKAGLVRLMLLALLVCM